MKKKILFISPEICPYTPNSEIGNSVLEKAKELSAKGHEIRLFIPKYLSIKDRKYQLHEVLRLHGLNIDINNVSQPITLKVVTIPKEKIQIYFIDNEDYYRREGEVLDEKGNMFSDAAERAILYAKASLEIIKRLHWVPDSIILQGWMSYFSIPFLKDFYKNDDTFKNSDIILNIFEEKNFGSFKSNMESILKNSGITSEFASFYSDNTYENLLAVTCKNCDTVVEKDIDLSVFFNQLIAIPKNV